MIKFKETYMGVEEEYFEKYDNNRNKLDFSLHRADGVRVIYDKNTGLYWEVKSLDENDVNYCHDKYSFEESKTFYIEKLNNNNYGGYSDWRIPNKDELRSIIDYGLDDIAINTDIFENCLVGDYWTKNTYKMQPYFGWVIFFGLGSGIAKSKKTKRYVIACRGGNEPLFGEADNDRFIDNQDGTITDKTTGLMWQKGENPRMNVYDAIKECANMKLAGYDNWRLPNIKELNSILNLDYTNNWWYFKNSFPADGLNPPLLHYFSSSDFKNKYEWVTNFCFGYDGYYGGKMAPLLFRACRDIDNDKKKVYRIPHTGEDTCYDVEGNLINIQEHPEYVGLDATRITSSMKYEVDNEKHIIFDTNTNLTWNVCDKLEKYTYEEACAAIRDMNACKYKGYSDWRVPNREELRTIVNYSGCIPAVDAEIFTDVKAEFYWAKELNKVEAGSAWGFYFGYGCAISYPLETKGGLIAVRGQNIFDIPNDERYVDNGDGTITDKLLDIMWMKGETPLLSLKEALEYCKNLELAGYNDWVLPNMKELGSLINIKDKDIAWYMKDLFPDTNTKPQGFYMSSTTYDATFGWGCNFQFGFDGYYADRKNGKYPFRPMRYI